MGLRLGAIAIIVSPSETRDTNLLLLGAQLVDVRTVPIVREPAVATFVIGWQLAETLCPATRLKPLCISAFVSWMLVAFLSMDTWAEATEEV